MIIVMNVILMESLKRPNAVFKCPQCGNQNPDTSDVVKRTCGYLGNPQKRPMVRGRHKEINARVKHIPDSIVKLKRNQKAKLANDSRSVLE